MVPPLRARTCDPSTEQSSTSSGPARRSSVSRAACRRGHTPASVQPVPQPTPGRHPGTAHGLRRDVPPSDTGPQHEQDSGKCCSVRNTQPPGMPAAPFGSGWQQRGHPLSQVVRNKISTHPDTLPTKIGECKTRGSTHSETITKGSDVARLRRALAAVPLPRSADGRLVPAADLTCWLRPSAHTSPQRILARRRHGRAGQLSLRALRRPPSAPRWRRQTDPITRLTL